MTLYLLRRRDMSVVQLQSNSTHLFTLFLLRYMLSVWQSNNSWLWTMVGSAWRSKQAHCVMH